MWVTSDFERIKEPISTILNNATTNDFVVFDIDATILHAEGTVTPEPTGMYIHEVAKINNIPIIYITARQDEPVVRERTMKDLAQVGIVDPMLVMYRPSNVMTWSGISTYKSESRQAFETRTQKHCLMNVGDQWTDLFTLDANSWNDLRRAFGNQYVLFSTCAGTRWNVKLLE